DEILVKLRQRLVKLTPEAHEAYEIAAGEPVRATLQRLHDEPPNVMANWIKSKAGLGPILDWQPESGKPIPLPISEHQDKVAAITTGYGPTANPEDFLSSFTQFVRDNVNQVAALQAVVQRPRELTRADLKALRMVLDARGFSEANLCSAWRRTKNEDIAATIVGFVRQAALGDPLVPWPDRVSAAIGNITKRGTWSVPQRKWLER